MLLNITFLFSCRNFFVVFYQYHTYLTQVTHVPAFAYTNKAVDSIHAHAIPATILIQTVINICTGKVNLVSTS